MKPNIIEKLEAIVRRPALYMGNSDNYFHSLNAFITGYSLVCRQLSPIHNGIIFADYLPWLVDQQFQFN